MKTIIIKPMLLTSILNCVCIFYLNAQINNPDQMQTVHPSALIQVSKAEFTSQFPYQKNTVVHKPIVAEKEIKKQHRSDLSSNSKGHQSENIYSYAKIDECVNPPVLQTNFEGNQRNRLNFPPLGWYPSECSIAISNAGKIVSVSNSWMYYFNQNGTVIFSDSLYHFANGIADEHVLYDPKADRFVYISNRGFSDFVTWFTPAPKMIAFSKTNDPMDGWNYYFIPQTDYHDNSIEDYPLLALSDSEAFITTNYFKSGWRTHVEVIQIKKSDGYTGASSLTMQTYDAPLAGSVEGSLVPAQGGSDTYGPDMYFIMSNEHSTGSNKYYVYEITNTIASGQAVLNRYAVVTSNISYTGNGLLYQYGGIMLEDQVAPKNDAIENAFYENGLIQFCQISKSNGNGKAAVIVGRISGVPNNLSCSAKLISDPNLYLSFPSIAYAGISSTDNSAIVGIERSGINSYPGLSAAFISSDFNLSPLVTIKAGNDTINGAYGDYSGICRRYNHPGEVWFEGQYGSLTDKKINWITKLHAPPACPVRIATEEINKLTVMPNPVSNITTISFSLLHSQNVSLKIFDLNGRLTATISDKVFEAGKNEFLWSVADIKEGIYFLQLQSEEKIQTIKVAVTK
jgi:hypothetical protein